jgi:hypothetical protein
MPIEPNERSDPQAAQAGVRHDEYILAEAQSFAPIPIAGIEEIRLLLGRRNPSALLLPVGAMIAAAGLVALLISAHRHFVGTNLILSLAVLFLAGYAVQAFAAYFRTRRHLVQIVAPALWQEPINFYVADSATEAALVLEEIRAVLQTTAAAGRA